MARQVIERHYIKTWFFGDLIVVLHLVAFGKTCVCTRLHTLACMHRHYACPRARHRSIRMSSVRICQVVLCLNICRTHHRL